MYKKILVALDESESSWKAPAAAVGLARTFGAKLHAIAVEGQLVADGVSLPPHRLGRGQGR